MKNEILTPLLVILGVFFTIVIVIFILPYISGLSIVDSNTSAMLDSTSSSLEEYIPIIAILTISGLAIGGYLGVKK